MLDMGTEMTAFIECDTAKYDSNTPARRPRRHRVLRRRGNAAQPHAGEDGIYTGSKDYAFFAAIAGVRNDTNIQPMFEPRGLPSNLSPEVKRQVKKWRGVGECYDSWLTTAEVRAALRHHAVDSEHVSFATHTILNIMADLEARLGLGRVRLVFGCNG